MTGLISSDEPTEAVSNQDQPFSISAIFCGVSAVTQEAHYLGSVLNGRQLGESPADAPGPAIMEQQDIPPCSPDGLCKVRTHLIARQTVRENHCAVRTCA